MKRHFPFEALNHFFNLERTSAMTDLVQLTIDEDIALITINNPPVNAISPGVPEGISEALDRSAQDNNIKAWCLSAAAVRLLPERT
jgi:enoyl-CoA hydratase/carnithine racemase